MVECIRTFGFILDLPPSILGVTILAWGNQVGDFFANRNIAKQGYTKMAMSGCFGEPIFARCFGLGIGFLFVTIAAYPEPYRPLNGAIRMDALNLMVSDCMKCSNRCLFCCVVLLLCTGIHPSLVLILLAPTFLSSMCTGLHLTVAGAADAWSPGKTASTNETTRKKKLVLTNLGFWPLFQQVANNGFKLTRSLGMKHSLLPWLSAELCTPVIRFARTRLSPCMLWVSHVVPILVATYVVFLVLAFICVGMQWGGGEAVISFRD